MTTLTDLYGANHRLAEGLSLQAAELNSRAQALQDVFALCVAHPSLEQRSYLEVGAHQPVDFNNTFTLASDFGWHGVSIELDTAHAAAWRLRRPADRIWFTDAINLDYDKVLKEIARVPRIGYLQLDIEPAANTLKTLKKVMESVFRFDCITFETDVYTGDTKPRQESRAILNALGYRLFAADVMVEFPPSSGNLVAFEDWWVDTQLPSNRANVKYFLERSFEGVTAPKILCQQEA